MDMENFTPLASTAGGALIGLSASLLLLSHGRIAGISGIFAGLLTGNVHDKLWRLMFVGGLLVGGLILTLLQPNFFAINVQRSTPLVLLAGLLVGFGTRLGSGCTSGHGICGISRLSPRSLTAVGTFMAAGMATAYVVNHVILGGAS